MSVTGILIATYGSVLLAELAGDRSIYTIASLTARFRPLPVLLGVIPAYGLKMLAAVLVADAVSHLRPLAVATISFVTWLLAAWAVWRREREESPSDAPRPQSRRPAFVAFASIAFTEWGDPGQLMAAGLGAHFHAPLLVWIGATAALVTKALAALVVGVTARRYLELEWLRLGATLFCLVNAAVVWLPVIRG